VICDGLVWKLNKCMFAKKKKKRKFHNNKEKNIFYTQILCEKEKEIKKKYKGKNIIEKQKRKKIYIFFMILSKVI
jgi:hypothetical protein